MLSAKIKKITGYNFGQDTGPEPLFHNLHLLAGELGEPGNHLSDIEQRYAASARHSISARVFIADPTDEQLQAFSRSFFGLSQPDNGSAETTLIRDGLTVRLSVAHFIQRSVQAFAEAPAVHIFLLQNDQEQVHMLADFLSGDLFQAALDIVASPNNLSNEPALQNLPGSPRQTRFFTFSDMEAFGSAGEFLMKIGLPTNTTFMQAYSFLKPLKNYGKHLRTLLVNRREQTELQLKSGVFDLENLKNGAQAKNRQHETAAKLSRIMREQALFVEEKLEQTAAGQSSLATFRDEALPLQQENIGNKHLHEIHPGYLSDKLRQLDENQQCLAAQVIEQHQRFCQNVPNTIPEAGALHLAPPHALDLLGISPGPSLRPEDYRFETQPLRLQQIFYGAFRPVFMVSMLFSVIGTVLGLFSGGMNRFSLGSFIQYFQNSFVPKLLGVALVIAVVYFLLRNYFSETKEKEHQLATEKNKLLLRLRNDLERAQADTIRRIKTNYKAYLERFAQEILVEQERLSERQSETSQRSNRERLRALELQLANCQDDFRSLNEAEKALASHEEAVREYEHLLLQKIRNT